MAWVPALFVVGTTSCPFQMQQAPVSIVPTMRPKKLSSTSCTGSSGRSVASPMSSKTSSLK
jgi:hypothetical protein